jgi:predicted transcriptional regulator
LGERRKSLDYGKEPIRRYSRHERKEILVELISKNSPRGLTTAQISKIVMIRYNTLTGILKEMVDEGKIRKIKFGNAYLYKIK